MQKFGGVHLLVEAIKQIPKHIDNIRFEFYGKEVTTELINLMNNDVRVEFKGFVSEYELESAFEKAHAFLSPLDLSYSDNNMVFPSKILNYLRYKKPILASKSMGISNEYDDILFYPDNNDVQGWLLLILKIYSFTIVDYDLVENKSEMLLTHKKWDKNVERIINFIETV